MNVVRVCFVLACLCLAPTVMCMSVRVPYGYVYVGAGDLLSVSVQEIGQHASDVYHAMRACM